MSAELACAYIASRTERAVGRVWLQGSRKTPLPCDDASPPVKIFAERRVYRVPETVAEGLVAWARGERPRVTTLFAVPTPAQVLSAQARGARFVSLLPDGVPAAPHEDGLAFAIHDLCHLEKFVLPADYPGQVGFFSTFHVAVDDPSWPEFEAGFDAAWQADRDHVAADMNGSAIFLFAALKMKLKMAVRRRLARQSGAELRTEGPLTPDETRAYDAALADLLDRFAFDENIARDAIRVSAKHDHPDAARTLLAHFEARGRHVLATGSDVSCRGR